jgi:hypothetical protein
MDVVQIPNTKGPSIKKSLQKEGKRQTTKLFQKRDACTSANSFNPIGY